MVSHHLKPFTIFGLSPTPKCCITRPETERGLTFDVGETFFRQESATGRDLAVLSAAVYKKSHNALRVLDAMCGCGIRSLRYLVEADADFVLANDANEDCGRIISGNLQKGGGEKKRWLVTHSDANRVFAECFLRRDYFDLIDVDSFGSESSFLRDAMRAVKLNGLLYLTSTDGYTSGGHRPQHIISWDSPENGSCILLDFQKTAYGYFYSISSSLDAYGAYIRPTPYSNEIGLRMLIGGAVREASVLGYHVVPLFSYYSFHGPVFRVMLQLRRGKLPNNRHYGFISYCTQCGNSQEFSWAKLGEIICTCNNVPGSLVVSGPLWTGPLHCAIFLAEIRDLAEKWGWFSHGSGKNLESLIKRMIDESDPLLPFGYIKLQEVTSRAKVNSPRLDTTLSTLHKEGYVAVRSHIASNAIKTNCSMVDCVRIVKQLQHTEENKFRRPTEAEANN